MPANKRRVITRAGAIEPGDGIAPRGEWLDVSAVEVEGDAMRFFELYRREFPAGRVVLGGNSAAGGDWGDEGTSQYIVVLVSE